jgi:ketosteroid isomerase-like protein
MSQENVELLRAFCATWDRDDPPDFLLLDPDVVFEDDLLPDHAGETYRGREGVMRSIRTWLEPYERFTIELEQIVESGDRLVSIHRFRYKAQYTGIEGEMRYAYLWTFRDGKVIHFRTFREPKEALEAVGLPE